MSSKARAWPLAIYNLLSVVAILLAWTVAHLLIGEEILPAPTTIASLFFSQLGEGYGEGTLIAHIGASAFRVGLGFLLAVCAAIPIGFAMGWYRACRGLLEPSIQFLRTVPPIAMIPLVIVVLRLGIDNSAKVFVIWLSAFLTIVIAVFQGVRNVDPTLVKAARVLGARDSVLFFDVIVPASLPYILVGMRLGLGAAWSTLVAAELINSGGGGLGAMIQEAGTFLRADVIILGVLLTGTLGYMTDRTVLIVERRLTRWQERVER